MANAEGSASHLWVKIYAVLEFQVADLFFFKEQSLPSLIPLDDAAWQKIAQIAVINQENFHQMFLFSNPIQVNIPLLYRVRVLPASK